jgi:hypothetical protein
MGETSAAMKALKLPLFDGEQGKSYQVWWLKFECYAAVLKFKQALQDGGEPELPDAEGTVLDLTSPLTRRLMPLVIGI